MIHTKNLIQSHRTEHETQPNSQSGVLSLPFRDPLFLEAENFFTGHFSTFGSDITLQPLFYIIIIIIIYKVFDKIYLYIVVTHVYTIEKVILQASQNSKTPWAGKHGLYHLSIQITIIFNIWFQITIFQLLINLFYIF